MAGQVSLLPDDLARMSRRPYRNLQTELNWTVLMSKLMTLPLFRVRWTRRWITTTPACWKNHFPRTTTSTSSKTRPRNAALRARRPRSLRPRPAWSDGASASLDHELRYTSAWPGHSETSTRRSTGRAPAAIKPNIYDLPCTCNVFSCTTFFLSGMFQI